MNITRLSSLVEYLSKKLHIQNKYVRGDSLRKSLPNQQINI